MRLSPTRWCPGSTILSGDRTGEGLAVSRRMSPEQAETSRVAAAANRSGASRRIGLGPARFLRGAGYAPQRRRVRAVNPRGDVAQEAATRGYRQEFDPRLAQDGQARQHVAARHAE